MNVCCNSDRTNTGTANTVCGGCRGTANGSAGWHELLSSIGWKGTASSWAAVGGAPPPGAPRAVTAARSGYQNRAADGAGGE